MQRNHYLEIGQKAPKSVFITTAVSLHWGYLTSEEMISFFLNLKIPLVKCSSVRYWKKNSVQCGQCSDILVIMEESAGEYSTSKQHLIG